MIRSSQEKPLSNRIAVTGPGRAKVTWKWESYGFMMTDRFIDQP
ncbi:MAG TPA: hypothetical protein PKN50_12065 [Spirochaetota bacterium]|nr:hypothetical protein [Spirochaetota bacterium]HPV39577.1 hypothetical protein [Spirochaetota bacterium]